MRGFDPLFLSAALNLNEPPKNPGARQGKPKVKKTATKIGENRAIIRPLETTTNSFEKSSRDGQVATYTEHMLFLSDGKITKEKEGLHLAKKNICPYCKGKLQPADEKCPSCGKNVLFKKKPEATVSVIGKYDLTTVKTEPAPKYGQKAES